MPLIAAAPFIGLGIVVIGAVLYDVLFGAHDYKHQAAQELRDGTSPLHRRPKASEAAEREMRAWHAKQAEIYNLRNGGLL